MNAKGQRIKKEPFKVHYQNYMDERKHRLLFLKVLSVVFTVICWLFMYPLNAVYSWFALVIMLPVIFITLKTARDAGKYARSMKGR